MEVLVDTCVWSLALRRSKVKKSDSIVLNQFSDLINESRVRIIGPIRQEILSGVSEDTQYQKLKKHLSFFEDLLITSEHYERAAEMSNHCRKKGITASHIDFLICAVSEFYHLSIFTVDNDFSFFSKYLPIRLFLE